MVALIPLPLEHYKVALLKICFVKSLFRLTLRRAKEIAMLELPPLWWTGLGLKRACLGHRVRFPLRFDPGFPSMELTASLTDGFGVKRSSSSRSFILQGLLAAFAELYIQKRKQSFKVFENVAAVSKTVSEQRSRHLGVAEPGGPLAEAEIGGVSCASALRRACSADGRASAPPKGLNGK